METKNKLFLITMLLGANYVKTFPDNAQDDVFHTEIIPNGDSDEVKIFDQNNKVVATVEVFENEGFQVEKPAEDDEPCFIRITEGQYEQINSSDTDICYVRREVSKEEAKGLGVNATRIIDNCKSIYVLEPQGCDVIDNKATGGNRQKRDWPIGNYCCHYKRTITTRCVRYVSTGCCRRFLGICTRRCKKCVSYSTSYITQKVCHTG